MFKQLLLLFTLFLVTGCGSSPQTPSQTKKLVSQWYTTPPTSTQTTLYALGEGKNNKEAVADALSTLLSTLNLTISSTFHTKTVVKEGFSSSKNATYTNEITTKLNTIEITNYQTLKSKKIGYKHFVALVSVEKQKLFNTLQTQIEEKFHLAKIQEKNTQKKTPLQKIQSYKKVLLSLNNLKNELKVMYSLNNSFKATPYLEKYAYFQTQLSNNLEKLSFYIKKKNTKNSLYSSIETGLSQKEFRVIPSPAKDSLFISLYENSTNSQAYGFFLKKTTLHIVVTDSKNRRIGENKHFITGQSTQSFKDATEDVAFKLLELIKKEGIMRTLGVKL